MVATPPPLRSVFSLLLRQLDAEFVLVGGAVQRGAWHVSWNLQVLTGEVGGGSIARAGGLGELYGLSLGHWASGQEEAPIQSLVQPHSCGLQGPQPPPFRRSSFVWLVPGPTDEWSRLAGIPASLSSDRGQGPRGSERGKTEAGSGRGGET